MLRRGDEVIRVQTRDRKWTVPIVTRTITDLEDIKALDPFVRTIELPG
jgi:hypothetical protein